jgi:D-amino peptidase
MKVFISADIEGTAGITDWDEALKEGANYQEFRNLMTAEVVAACEGACAAGANEIIVKDAHQTGRNILVSELPEYVQIIRGWSGHPYSMMQGITPDCAAALFTGYHNQAGADTNPLAHTFTGKVSRLLLNGEIASEFTINAFCAALVGVPPVFLSGDGGMCSGAKKIVPNISTLSVSEGHGPSTTSMAPSRAVAEIREAVEAALSADLSACSLELPPEFELVVEFTNPVDAYRVSWYPGAQQVEPRAVRFVSDDYFEILRSLTFLLK